LANLEATAMPKPIPAFDFVLTAYIFSGQGRTISTGSKPASMPEIAHMSEIAYMFETARPAPEASSKLGGIVDDIAERSEGTPASKGEVAD
jgi:hypothetical protein